MDGANAPHVNGIELALADLEARHLVRVVEEGRRLTVRLAHPLYGEAVRAWAEGREDERGRWPTRATGTRSSG